MEHLTDDQMDALARGEPAAVSHFRAHLANSCAHCEAYLRTAEGRLQLDAAADALLLGRSGGEDGRGYASVKAKLRGRRRAVAGSAAALVACAAALLLFIRPTLDPAGIKGGGPLLLEVMAAHQRPDGSTVRVDPSATLPARGILLIRYHASESGSARILRQRPNEKSPTVLGTVKLEAGTHDLPSGISLDGESGPSTFVLEAESDRGQRTRVELPLNIEAR